MKSVKELTEKLKKLNIENYIITCDVDMWNFRDDTTTRYCINILDPYHQKPLRFSIRISLNSSEIKFYLGIGCDSNLPLVREFKNNTYSEKEKTELKLTLEEIKEFSNSNLLKEFNSFLHE